MITRHAFPEFGLFFPHLADLIIGGMEWAGSGLTLCVSTATLACACPNCEVTSARTHGSYQRTVHDAPVSGQALALRLRMRRFKCVNPHCPTVTFAEQIPGLTSPFARYTAQLAANLASLGLALAGRAGTRLASDLGIAVSRHTLLRQVMALPDPRPTSALEICGIDDFALKKGKSYGTIIVDLGTNRILDLLPGRTAEPVAAWLAEHGADIAVICRDRAGAYASAADSATPAAMQIADRWHLWHNLCQAVTCDIAEHQRCMKPTAPTLAQPRPIPTGQQDATGENRLAQRIRDRHAQIHELLDQGWIRARIQQHLKLDFKTVQRYARAEHVEDLLGGSRHHCAANPFQHEAARLWNQGVTDCAAIHRHLTELGYTGSTRTVRRMVEPYRGHPEPMPAQLPAPKTGRLTSLITSHPDTLTDEDRTVLTEMAQRCHHLDDLRKLVESFATMLTARTGNEHLDPWIATTGDSGFPAIAKFAKGLTNDYHAVKAGLSLPYSSGAVEGSVNKLKAVKRQTYGRAGLPLLRKRLLLL